MSYPNNQQYPAPGGPPPPQQGYGQPPAGQYPPGQYPPPSYPPQQQAWGAPPNQQYPPQGYPPQQYPPPQQPYGQPPQGQYPPPQGQYGAPPPGQYPPPQQQWGQPPAGYGSPAPPPGQYPPQGYPPQQQQQQYYGAPPPGQYGGYPTQAIPPSPGYGPAPQNINVTAQVEGLYKAMKGFGTNEKQLIAILPKLDPIQVNAVRAQYNQRYHEDLIKRLESETSGNFEDALVQIARGPLLSDVWNLRAAMKGMGTKESVLNDVLIGRSNADINAIKREYQQVHGRSLEGDLRSDLSAATEQMFIMIVSAQRSEEVDPVNPQQVERDVAELQGAFGNFMTKNSVKACQILTSRSDAQIRAIAQRYEQQYGQPFVKTLKRTFDGHMEQALLLLVARAQNRALSDAEQLEDAMAGLGTNDTLLIQRVVRAHWDKQHMQRVRSEYQRRYGKDLVKRIKGETRGDYEKTLVACVE
ncbi:Annexin [Westerdykella ornata]|uniref:Annexin n=1 Tax=Westerdykella ornata TaxID=318751 RepID=A0A6A6JUT5_WESOR|nr:Annexin [Westerdykella ornata]KAF2279578.1 Annexin [Westerdykella ornata]